MSQKALDTAPLLWNVECQVSFAPPCIVLLTSRWKPSIFFTLEVFSWFRTGTPSFIETLTSVNFAFLWQFRWWNGGIIWHRDEVSAGWRQGVAAWRKEATPSFSSSLYCLVYVFPRIPIRLALEYTEISRQNLLFQYVMSNQVTNKFAGVEA